MLLNTCAVVGAKIAIAIAATTTMQANSTHPPPIARMIHFWLDVFDGGVGWN